MASDIITAEFQSQVMHYVVLVPTIILYYDHILTLFQEVEWIWMRNLTLPTGLFLVLRYSTTFWEILYLSLLFDAPFFPIELSCEFMVKVPMAYFVLHVAIMESILMLRTYALYRRNKIVLSILLCYILAQIISTLLITLDVTITDVGIESEFSSLSITTIQLPDCDANMPGDAITIFWWLSLGYDTLVFVLTFFKIHRLRKKVSAENFPSLLKVITRDGLLFYVLICVLNLVNVWSYYYLSPNLKVASINFSFSLSTTMVSRLVLNIQDASKQNVGRFSYREAETNQETGVLTTAPSVVLQGGVFKRSVWDPIEDLHSNATRLCMLEESSLHSEPFAP